MTDGADMRNVVLPLALLSVGVVIAGLLWFSTNLSAQPNKEELYKLQEQCGKRAEEVFRRQYFPISNTKDGLQGYEYENHYNAKLNKCFFLVTYVLWGKQSKRRIELWDLNEHKQYGHYSAGDN